jgi:hypothetical protein
MTKALDGGEGSASRPGRSLPPGKTWYPLYRRLGGRQGRSGQVQKISPPPGFDSQTGQPDRLLYPAHSRLNPKSNIFRLRTILFFFLLYAYRIFSQCKGTPLSILLCSVRIFFSVTCILDFRENIEVKVVFYLWNPHYLCSFCYTFYVHVLTF